MNRPRMATVLLLPLALLLLAPAAAAQLRGEPGRVFPAGNPDPHPPSQPRGPRGIDGERSTPAPSSTTTYRRVGSRAEAAKAYIRLGDEMAKDQPPDYKGAAWAYRRAAEIDPQQARAFEGLGEVYAAQQRDDEAVVAFGEAVKLMPKRAELHYQLGSLFQKMGETAAAREKLQLLRGMKKKELAARLEAQLDATPRQ